MSPPCMAADESAEHEQSRLAAAATGAVGKAHADGVDLDDPHGAALAFSALADAAGDLPLPGRGRTLARWAGLAAVGMVDVTLGRLFEAHADALAICAELGARTEPGQRWGVWAAEGPRATVRAQRAGTGWQLTGSKPWCSGATSCTHALVTAAGPDGRALFAVALDPATCTSDPSTWRAVGLAGSATEAVEFREAPAVQVGAPGAYLNRPGFWQGAVGVAAVWWGAAFGVARLLYDAAASTSMNAHALSIDAHALAHLGAVEVALASSAALLREVATRIDAAPHARIERSALTTRAAVEAAADNIITRVGRALGPAPLCQDRAHARRVADLSVYLRQSHAEADLRRIGELLRTNDPPA